MEFQRSDVQAAPFRDTGPEFRFYTRRHETTRAQPRPPPAGVRAGERDEARLEVDTPASPAS